MRILLYRALGTFFLGLGFLGLVLPLFPGTVFVLAAAYCFARSSPRLYGWLARHPRFGVYLRNWEERRAMPRGAKVIALVFTALGAAWIFLVVSSPWIQAAVVVGALGLIGILLRIPVY